MTNNYYKDEFTPENWKKAIDLVLSWGCVVSYNKYGNICCVDSTETETRMIDGKEWRRFEWAQHIHDQFVKVAQTGKQY